MTEIRLEDLEIPGVRVGAENPLPFFRDKKINREVPLREAVDAEKRQYFGNASGRRLLPYRMQDHYTRARGPYTMRVAILENQFLKATFWIELGCRMMSLIYKPLQRELLFNNPVFQPANLASAQAVDDSSLAKDTWKPGKKLCERGTVHFSVLPRSASMTGNGWVDEVDMDALR